MKWIEQVCSDYDYNNESNNNNKSNENTIMETHCRKMTISTFNEQHKFNSVFSMKNNKFERIFVLARGTGTSGITLEVYLFRVRKQIWLLLLRVYCTFLINYIMEQFYNHGRKNIRKKVLTEKHREIQIEKNPCEQYTNYGVLCVSISIQTNKQNSSINRKFEQRRKKCPCFDRW